jgi:signal transduction histidine kinase
LGESSHFVIYYRNITEDRILYEKMIQNEKMAALGLLAGNIAHELNNPLTGIRSLAQILRKEPHLKKEYLSDLEEIDKASHRCQNIIQGLKDFSDIKEESLAQIKHLEKTSLNDIVTKTLPFLKSALREHQLILDLSNKDVQVVTDSRILQQILFNIVINACQALTKPGKIEIHTEKRGISGILEIKDNGPGISKEIQDKIFDPFFTTKKDGEGTGLGLSFCKNMIEKMGGQISFESQVNKGTVFKLKIPTQGMQK